MPTARKKLPDHVYLQLELAETHIARIARTMRDIETTMNDKRGINPYKLEKLHARVGESTAIATLALALIERQEPLAENGSGGAVDRAWLTAMAQLTHHAENGRTLETIRAFIDAKIAELDA